MTYFQVAPGETIEDTHMNAAIRQGIPPFASAAARDAAIPAPVAGQHCYLTDTGQVQVYRAGAWRPTSSPPTKSLLTLNPTWSSPSAQYYPLELIRNAGMALIQGLIAKASDFTGSLITPPGSCPTPVATYVVGANIPSVNPSAARGPTFFAYVGLDGALGIDVSTDAASWNSNTWIRVNLTYPI